MDQLGTLKSQIDNLLSKPSSPSPVVLELVQRLVQDDVATQVSRGALAYFAQQLSKLPEEKLEEIAQATLGIIKAAPNSFDDSEYIIREALFALYVKWGQYSEAAQSLSALDLSSVVRPYTDLEKADIYVKCAEAYLEDDASVEAEVFVNKASPFINDVSDVSLQLRYRVTHARVLDANRKFADAALRYYELSKINTINVVPEELLELLAKAVTCAILGKTGHQRARVLALLYNDERLSQLDQLPKYASHSIILAKMHKEQIIRKNELTIFEATLQDHQKAYTAEGFTLLEKAVLEHNLMAISRIYLNIALSQLSFILHIDVKRAEKIAATMISEHRLKAKIDQVENLLIFEEEADPLVVFNAQIAGICQEVNNFVNILQV